MNNRIISILLASIAMLAYYAQAKGFLETNFEGEPDLFETSLQNCIAESKTTVTADAIKAMTETAQLMAVCPKTLMAAQLYSGKKILDHYTTFSSGPSWLFFVVVAIFVAILVAILVGCGYCCYRCCGNGSSEKGCCCC